MQTDEDAARILRLGLPPERIGVSGNIKFDLEIEDGEHEVTSSLRERFHLKNGRRLIVAASTHAPEERTVLEAFKTISGGPHDSRPRLLIAPRHPERFRDVEALLSQSGLTWVKRSAARSARDANCDVILLDSIGELRAVYRLAEIVFVGGSLAPVGGHNVLEPAAAGVCVITGPHTENFTSIVRTFVDEGALIQIPSSPEADYHKLLAEALGGLLHDDRRRREIAACARGVLESNRGATERTVRLIAPLFNGTLPKQAHTLPGTEKIVSS